MQNLTDFNFLLFDGYETLDAMGPAQIIGRLENIYRPVYLSLTGGTVTSSQGVQTLTLPVPATGSLSPLLIPGGLGTRTLVNNDKFIETLKIMAEQAQYVLTVCTGSALLAKTGLLDHRRATTNKRSFEWAASHGPRVNWQKKARWTEDGKYFTSSGVSAGMDMTLGFTASIHGREQALAVAKRIEYLWNEDRLKDPFSIE